MEGDSYVFVVGELVRGVKEIQSVRALKFLRERLIIRLWVGEQ